jgi:hypothetical protein
MNLRKRGYHIPLDKRSVEEPLVRSLGIELITCRSTKMCSRTPYGDSWCTLGETRNVLKYRKTLTNPRQHAGGKVLPVWRNAKYMRNNDLASDEYWQQILESTAFKFRHWRHSSQVVACNTHPFQWKRSRRSQDSSSYSTDFSPFLM